MSGEKGSGEFIQKFDPTVVAEETTELTPFASRDTIKNQVRRLLGTSDLLNVLYMDTMDVEQLNDLLDKDVEIREVPVVHLPDPHVSMTPYARK